MNPFLIVSFLFSRLIHHSTLDVGCSTFILSYYLPQSH